MAVLGCRARGTEAARAYRAHPRTTVVGLCDLVEDRLDLLGNELEVPPSARYRDLDTMIAEIRPDLVAIPTGTEFHHQLCLRVLRHGVNIEVEKPICVDLEQADAVLAAAREQQVSVAVHHQTRVGSPMRAVTSALAEGRIGALRSIQVTGKGYYGGYDLFNIGTHVLHNIIKFAGRCQAVSAIALTGGRPITPEDVVMSPSGMGTIVGEHITALLEFANGVTATVLEHRFPAVDQTGAAFGFELLGTEGRLLWRVAGAWWLPQPYFVPNGRLDRWLALPYPVPEHYDPASGATEADFAFVDEYVRALDQGRDHECSGDEGRHGLEIIMAILEAAAYGSRVTLPQSRRDHPLLRWRREHGLGAPPEVPRGYAEWLAAEDRRLGRGDR